MITASGAEGISLRNVQYVHIVEPYWHPVRIQQVIGRARRICSHQDLNEEYRKVDVFLYLMTFSKKQLESDESIELRLKDKSKIDGLTPITSDESLYEISSLKEDVIERILTAVKESSIDCAIHSKDGENLKCFTFGSANSSRFAYTPSITNEEADVAMEQNVKEIKWKAKKMKLNGVNYAYRQDTKEAFDYDAYLEGIAIKIGDLEIEGDRYRLVPI